MVDKIQEHREIMSQTPITAQSSSGRVAVRRDTRGTVTVRIDRDAFRRLDAEHLAEEVASALENGFAEYSRMSHDVLDRLTGADIERRLAERNKS